AARTDREGTFHLLYNMAGGPYYARSTDNGITFRVPIPVVHEESRKPGLDFDGAGMVVGKGGRIHVALSTNAWKVFFGLATATQTCQHSYPEDITNTYRFWGHESYGDDKAYGRRSFVFCIWRCGGQRHGTTVSRRWYRKTKCSPGRGIGLT